MKNFKELGLHIILYSHLDHAHKYQQHENDKCRWKHVAAS